MPLHEMSIYTEKTSSNRATMISTSATPSLVAQLGSYKAQSLTNISASVQQQQQELIPMKYGYNLDSSKLPTEGSIAQCDQQAMSFLDCQGQKWSDVIDFNKALNELRLAELRLNGDYSSSGIGEGSDEGIIGTRKKEQIFNQESDDNRRWRHKNLRQVQRLMSDDIHFYGIVPKITALKLAVCDICMGVYTIIGLKKHYMIHHPAMWSNLPTTIGASTATASLSDSLFSRNEKHHSEIIHDTTSLLAASSSSSSSIQQINADLFGSSPSDGTMSAGSSLSSCSTSITASNIGYIPNISTTNKRQKSSRGGQNSATGSGSKSSRSRSRNKGKHNKSSNEISNVPLTNSLLLSSNIGDVANSSNVCSQQLPEATGIATSKKSSKRKHATTNIAPNVSIAQFDNVGSSKGVGCETGDNVNLLAATTKESLANTETKILNNVVFNNLPTTAINLNPNCNANGNALIVGNHNRSQNIKNFAATASLSSTSASLTSGLYPSTSLSLTLSSSSSSNSSTSSTSCSLPPTPKMISTTIQENSVISGHSNLPIITEYPLSPIVLSMKDSSNSIQDTIAATALLQQNYDNFSIKTNNKKKVKKSSSSHSGRKSSHTSAKGESLVISQRKDDSNKITIVKLPILPSKTSSTTASITSPVVGITANSNIMDNCVQQQTEQQYRAQIIELNEAVNSITELNTDANDYNTSDQMQSQAQQQQQFHHSQQVVDFAISNHQHHQELQEGNHGCVENDVGSIHHNNSSEDSVMLKHVLEEFNMLDSKVINEILNSSETDINFDETQLNEAANGGVNHQQQQQQQQQQIIDMYVMEQQNETKRMRYDGQLIQAEQPETQMMLSVNRENGLFTIYPQQQHQQQSQTTYSDATIYNQTCEETRLPNQFQQPMESIQLQNLMYQQHSQQPSVVAYETVVDDGIHHQVSPQEQQQPQLTGNVQKFYSDADHNQSSGQIQMLTEMSNDKLKEDDKTEVYATLYTAGDDDESQVIESFEIDTVPSLTDDYDMLQSEPSSASRLSNTYVISNQDNESQYQIYQINSEQRCMELMTSNQNDASNQYQSIQSDIIVNVAKDSRESQSLNMAIAPYEEIKQPQADMKQLTTEDDEQQRLIAEELLDFDYSLVETVNSKSAEFPLTELNRTQSQDFDRETLHRYAGIPRPLSINTFGLRKLPQSVSTTFQKSLQNSRKANNSLTSLTAGLRSTFLSGTRTSFLSPSNRFGNSHHKQQATINNVYVNNPVVTNGLNQVYSYYSCNMTEGNNNATNSNWMNGGGVTHNNAGIHSTTNAIKVNNSGSRIKISSIAGGNAGIGVILPGLCINSTKNRYNTNNCINESFPAIGVTNFANNTTNNKDVSSVPLANNVAKTILVTGSVNAFNANQLRSKAITSRNIFLSRSQVIQTKMDNNHIPFITTNRLNELLNSNEHSLQEMRELSRSEPEELEDDLSIAEDSVSLSSVEQNVARRMRLLKLEEPNNYSPHYLLTGNEEHTLNQGSETKCNSSMAAMTNGEVLCNEAVEAHHEDYSRVNNFYERRRKLLQMGREHHQHHHHHQKHTQLSKPQLLEYQTDCTNSLSNNLEPTWSQQQPQQARLFQQTVTRNMSDCGINSNNASNNVPSTDVNVMQVFV